MKKRLICVLLEFVLISSVFLNAVLAQSDITKTEDGPVSGLEVIKTGDETPVEEIVGDITVEGKDDVNGIITSGSGASEVEAQNVDVTANSSDNTTYAAGVTSSEEDNIEISGSVSVSAENTASPNEESTYNSSYTDAVGVETNDQSTVTVEENVTVQGEANVETGMDYSSVNTTGVETNNESSATVNGDVTVTTEVNADPGSGYINTETTGVETNNESTATVNGDVTVTTEVNADSGSGYISANTTGVETNNESSVTVEGNVSVTTNIPAENTGYTDTKGIDANGESTATVSGEVNVNVEATFTNTEEGSKYVQTTGIEYDPGTNVNVDSVNVTVDTQGASSTYTRGVSSSYSGSSEETTEVIVNTDITVTSTAEDGSSTAYGIYDSGNSPADFDIDGKVSAEANAENGNANAYGIYESSSGSNPDGAAISAAGNVEVKAEGGTDASATGINAYNNSDGPIAVWTEDVVVDVNAGNGSASGTGVSANAYDNGHVNVNAANIDVTVVGNAEEEKFTRTYTVYPGTSSPDEAHSGETTVIVRNDITVEAESSTLQANATGIRASSSGNPEPQENSGKGNTGNQEPYEVTREYTRVVSGTGVSASGTNTNVEVEGDITVTADSDRGTAVGIYAYSNNDGITIVDAGGSIMVSTSDADLNKDNTEAIYAAVYGSGTVDITVGKDENVDQHGIITEGGNIVSDGNGIIVQTDGDATGSVEIEVKGDVTAENHGLEINAFSDEAVADIIVNGTLSGKEASIVIGSETTADNVQLTLWKVDLTEVEGEQQQHAVTQEIYVKNEETQQIEKEQFVTEETKKIEENIRYIIKIEKNENAELGVEGTEKVDDYDTAKEGDNVIFTVRPKEGFQVKAAYNGLGERVPLVKDASGNYFVIVERGGGVYLSVELDGGALPQPIVEPTQQNEEPQQSANQPAEENAPSNQSTQPVQPVYPTLQSNFRGTAIQNGVRKYNAPSYNKKVDFSVTYGSGKLFVSVDGGKPEALVNGQYSKVETEGVHSYRITTEQGSVLLSFEIANVSPVSEYTVYGKPDGTDVYSWPMRGSIRNDVSKAFNEAITITGKLGDYLYVAGKDISGGAFVHKNDVKAKPVTAIQPTVIPTEESLEPHPNYEKYIDSDGTIMEISRQYDENGNLTRETKLETTSSSISETIDIYQNNKIIEEKVTTWNADKTEILYETHLYDGVEMNFDGNTFDNFGYILNWSKERGYSVTITSDIKPDGPATLRRLYGDRDYLLTTDYHKGVLKQLEEEINTNELFNKEAYARQTVEEREETVKKLVNLICKIYKTEVKETKIHFWNKDQNYTYDDKTKLSDAGMYRPNNDTLYLNFPSGDPLEQVITILAHELRHSVQRDIKDTWYISDSKYNLDNDEGRKYKDLLTENLTEYGIYKNSTYVSFDGKLKDSQRSEFLEMADTIAKQLEIPEDYVDSFNDAMINQIQHYKYWTQPTEVDAFSTQEDVNDLLKIYWNPQNFDWISRR